MCGGMSALSVVFLHWLRRCWHWWLVDCVSVCLPSNMLVAVVVVASQLSKVEYGGSVIGVPCAWPKCVLLRIWR